MKKAQAATEYILVAALVAMVIIPVGFIFQKYTQGATEEMQAAQVQQAGLDIVTHAETIYYMGAPARIQIEESLPSGVQNMSFFKDWTMDPPVSEFIVYARFHGKPSENSFLSRIKITDSSELDPAEDKLPEEASAEGNKKIWLEAWPGVNDLSEPFVLVDFGERCPVGTYNGGVVQACGVFIGNMQPDCTNLLGTLQNTSRQGISWDHWFNHCQQYDLNGDCMVNSDGSGDCT
ncbi:MAG: hypothetical protein GY861_15750 [bacterium]|nr:hypothetical protein [bacterium]